MTFYINITIVKSQCGSKFRANFEEIKALFEEQFAINSLLFFAMANVAIATEKVDVERVTKQLIQLVKDNYAIAIQTLNL